MNKTIGIVGGAGFLGSRLSKLFKESKQDYLIMDINDSSIEGSVYLNVEDSSDFEKFSGLDCIINLAAMHRDDVRPVTRYDDVNIKGAENVCQAARSHGINRIIFTSSVAIYGFAPPNTDENGDANYFNDYGRTKYLAEQVYKEWQSEDPKNRTLVIVRPTVIFGEGNRGNVYNLLKQIAARRFVMFGNGENKKSMAYVENVAAFLNHSLTFKAGLHIHNYIDKPDFDMNTLISKTRETLFKKSNVGIRFPALIGISIGYVMDFLAGVSGKNFPVSSIRVKKFLGTTQFDSSARKTGFVPPISLEEGLYRTLHYEFLEDNSDERTFETE